MTKTRSSDCNQVVKGFGIDLPISISKKKSDKTSVSHQPWHRTDLFLFSSFCSSLQLWLFCLSLWELQSTSIRVVVQDLRNTEESKNVNLSKSGNFEKETNPEKETKIAFIILYCSSQFVIMRVKLTTLHLLIYFLIFFVKNKNIFAINLLTEKI